GCVTSCGAVEKLLANGTLLIHTDQRSLSHLNEQRLNTPWQQKIFTKLSGLQYKIVYKRVWRIECLTMRHKVISVLHDYPFGGHSGVLITLSRLKQLVDWRGMRRG